MRNEPVDSVRQMNGVDRRENHKRGKRQVKPADAQTVKPQHSGKAVRPIQQNRKSDRKNNLRGEPLPPQALIPGLLNRARDMTLFLNPDEQSYLRLGRDKAPRYVSWSEENRSQLVRLPAANGEYRRVELRAPDSMTNPYLAFYLMIHACLEGIDQKLPLPEPANFNTFSAPHALTQSLPLLPSTLADARVTARESAFIASHVPARILERYL